MKRLIYTGLLLFGLFAVSCQKEDIRPNSDDWSCFPGYSEGGCGTQSRGADDPDPSGDNGDDGGGIVDPNGEQEGSDKPGQHNQN